MNDDYYYSCRKGGTFHSPRMDSCLTLGNELSKEISMLTKQETIGRDAQVESRQVRETRRMALPHGSQSQVLW